MTEANAPRPASAPPAQRVNIPGIISLAFVAVHIGWSVVIPLVLSQTAMSTGSGLSLVLFLPLISFAVSLGAIISGLVGVLNRSATRLRWMAVGGLVSGSAFLLSNLAGAVGGWLASLVM